MLRGRSACSAWLPATRASFIPSMLTPSSPSTWRTFLQTWGPSPPPPPGPHRTPGAGDPPAPLSCSLKASAVEPDVRVETQDTLSLGEDRTVLAANAVVDITRAGLFRLSFFMPSGFDVESISGPALSHWTELQTEAGRVITLNLRGKTLGK